ncbi:MAG: hypothetical protein Q7N50_03435 [Armatimonadota bacterium]|nr:hypothetical protein [Armatimonadota bacterium]
MRRKSSRKSYYKPRRTYRRRRVITARRRTDPVILGAQIGGLAGVALLMYGLIGDKLPPAATEALSSGFALSLGIALITVAICLYFSSEAGWFDRETRGNRRPRTRRAYTRRYR